MHPRTKSSVIHGRQVQLGLRILSLLGALGSLFCAIVIKNVAVTMVWIVRVAVSIHGNTIASGRWPGTILTDCI